MKLLVKALLGGCGLVFAGQANAAANFVVTLSQTVTTSSSGQFFVVATVQNTGDTDLIANEGLNFNPAPFQPYSTQNSIVFKFDTPVAVGQTRDYNLASISYANLPLGMTAVTANAGLTLVGADGTRFQTFVAQSAQASITRVVDAVPEPATWAMLLVGFGMIGAASRYRRRTIATTFA